MATRLYTCYPLKQRLSQALAYNYKLFSVAPCLFLLFLKSNKLVFYDPKALFRRI